MAGRRRLVYRQDPDGMYRARPEVQPAETKSSKKGSVLGTAPSQPTLDKPAAAPVVAQPKYMVEPEDNELITCEFKVPNWDLETDSPIAPEPPTSKSAEFVVPADASTTASAARRDSPQRESKVPLSSPVAVTATSTVPSSPIAHTKTVPVYGDNGVYLDLNAPGSPVLESFSAVSGQHDLKTLLLGGVLGFVVAHLKLLLLSHTKDIASTIKIGILFTLLILASCGWMGLITMSDLLLLISNGRSLISSTISGKNSQVNATINPIVPEEMHNKEEKPETIKIFEAPVAQQQPPNVQVPLTVPVSASNLVDHTEQPQERLFVVPATDSNSDHHDKLSVLTEESIPEKSSQHSRPRARSLSPIQQKKHRPSNVYVNITPYKATPRKNSDQKPQSLGLPRSRSAAEWQPRLSAASNGFNPPPFARTPSGGIPSRVHLVHHLKDSAPLHRQSMDNSAIQYKKLPPEPDHDEDPEDLPFINKVNSLTSEELKRMNRERRASTEMNLGRSMSNASKRSTLQTRANYTKFVSNVPEIVQY